MKDLLPEAEPTPPSHSDLRPATASPTLSPEQERPRAAAAGRPGPPSLLDHLRRGRLAEAWDTVVAERPEPLPGQAVLERRFHTSLGQVRVHSGPAARTLLDHLGAQGAALGRTVLLRDRTGGGAVTAAHEVAHVLQAPMSPGRPGVVLPHDDEAELEAEGLATGVLVPRGDGRVRARIPVGAVALRRSRQRPADTLALLAEDPTARDDPAEAEFPTSGERPTTHADDASDVTRESPEAEDVDESGEAHLPEEAEAEEPSSGAAVAEGAADDSGVATGAPREGERTASEAAGATEVVTPDRQIELRDELETSQQRWDEGAAAADRHEIAPCPEHANQPGTHQFSRGPPLEVPATRVEQIPEPAVPVTVPHGRFERAQRSVERQLDTAPARAPPRDAHDLSAEERAELARARLEIEQEIRSDLRRSGPQGPEGEGVVFAGDADPARIDRARDAATGSLEKDAGRAREGAEEDFGESVMAPAVDPTLDLDTGLDGLEIPQVEVASMVETARLDLVATEANVGVVPVDQVVLVTDAQIATVQQHAEIEAGTRQVIDQELIRGDRQVDGHCARARTSRDRTEENTRRGVGERRGQWTQALDHKVATRGGEAERLVVDRRAHVERLQRETDRDADTVLAGARQDAQDQWSEAERRARNKADEPNDSGWFQGGIDWLRDALSDLVEWIDDFIDACREAIDALLDAAAALAHGIIEAGRRAVAVTIDGLKAGLDLIADNLPGELGEIAREYRDDIHGFLDEQQAAVDAWAGELHHDVDESIEGLRTELHEALDTFQETVHEKAALIDEFLENGLMAFLRAHFPGLAALIDDGLLAPVRRAGDMLSDWLDSALEATGVAGLQEALAGIDTETMCEPATEEEQAQDCEAFRATLEGVLETVDAILASPVAQRIQAFLTEQRDETAAAQVDATSGFFSFIAAVARPVYEWWLAIEPTVQSVLDELGSIASTIWRHVAEALGIDPNLSPLEALQQGLELLWEAVTEAVAPIVDGIKDAWDWLRNRSFLAPVFDFFASLPQLWDALTSLVSHGVDAAGEWLTRSLDTLKNTILPVVDRVANRLADLVLSAADVVEQWIDGIVAGIDRILNFQAAIALVEVLVNAVARLVAPVRTLLVLFKGCVLRAWRWLGTSLRDFVGFLRTLLDIAAGLALALLTFPIGLVAFFAGNVWLHLVPACYKGALINFFLDVAIRFLRFLPQPADFVLLVLHQGALSFLEGIRAAPDEQKIAAVDLFASIFAGNAEVLAGFLVGVAEGVWDATGGTIIFLLKAVAWLAALPFKLAAWGIGMLRGDLPNQGGSGGGVTTADRIPTAPDGLPRARGPPQAHAVSGDITQWSTGGAGDSGAEQSESLSQSRRDAVPVEERSAGDLEALEREVSSDTEPVGGPVDERDRRARAIDSEVAAERAEGAESVDEVSHATEEAAAEDEQDDSRTTGASPERQSSEELSRDGATPPPAPSGLRDLQAALHTLMTEGVSRADVMTLLDGARAALRSMVGRLARDAATALLDALTGRGAAFSIGRVLGAIVGELLVQVLLAVLTAGASAGVAAAKAAITGARVTVRFASVIAKVKRALDPLLRVVQRLRGALGDLIRAVRRWFDDVLDWMRGLTRRAGRRGHGPTSSRGHGPGRSGERAPQHGRGRDGGRDAPDRRRRREEDRESPAERRRRRLRTAIAYMRPRLLPRLIRGVDRRRLQRRLLVYQRMFGLTSVRLPTRHGRGRIIARINPSGPVVQEYDASERQRLSMVKDIADDVLVHKDTLEAETRIFGGDRTVPQMHGRGAIPAAVRHERGRQTLPNPGTVERRGLAGTTVQERRAGYPNHSVESRRGNALVQFRGADGTRTGGGAAHSYPALAQILDGLPVNQRELAQAMQRIASGQPLDPTLTPEAVAYAPLLADTVYLMFVREGVRDPRSLVWASMSLDLLERGRVGRFADLMGGAGQIGLTRAGRRARVLAGGSTGGLFPPSMVGFVQRVRQLNARVLDAATTRTGRGQAAAERRLIVARNERVVEQWAKHDDTVTHDLHGLKAVIRDFVLERFGLE